MPNGYSRVTWIEHAEVEENPVNQIFSNLVASGEAFGARRWLAVLQRQCERVASLMARNLSDLGVIPSPEARKNMMNLAQRMIKTFCVNISTSLGQSWTSLSDSAEDTVRITTRKVTEPGQPAGLILSAVSTTWLPYHHFQVFDLLRDERHRAQLDALSNGNSLHEVAHIANGSHPGNCISLLRINVASNSSQSVELMLQESCTDDSGSLVVYATMDVDAIQLAMSGDDPSAVPLLPLGFVITPMAPPAAAALSSEPESLPESGCLLTVALQVLASTIPTAKLNLSCVTAINHHLCNTVQQINAALSGLDDTAAATTAAEQFPETDDEKP
nr:homeobox-leucine zipper protein HDG5 isoform X1 [Ipomoea batatas]